MIYFLSSSSMSNIASLGFLNLYNRFLGSTARMIDWDKEGDAFARVQVWLGHADPKDTTIYVQLHRLWDDNKGS